MKQIQKCPHCGKDVLFCGVICPHCGHSSSAEERGAADLAQLAGGRQPVYLLALDSVLSPMQQRGRLLLGWLLGVLLLPLVTWNGVNLCLLWTTDQGHELPWGLAMLFLLVAVIIAWKTWQGFAWAMQAAIAMTTISGVILLKWMMTTTVRHGAQPMPTLVGGVMGLVCLMTAWILKKSPNIKDFLLLQAKKRG